MPKKPSKNMYCLWQCDECQKVWADTWLAGGDKSKCSKCGCEGRFVAEL